jgi:hypothetical protein
MIELFILPIQIFLALFLSDLVREYRVRRKWKDDWEFENGLDGDDF